MPSLSIRIDPPADGSGVQTGMVAELARLEPADGSARLTRKVSVMTSADSRVDDLAPGRWDVSIVTATGRSLTQEVVVGDGTVAEARFSLPSPSVERSERRSIHGTGLPPAGPPTGVRLTRGTKSAVGDRLYDTVEVPFPGGNRSGPGLDARVDVLEPQLDPVRRGDEVRAFWAQLSDSLARGAVPRFLWLGVQPARAALGTRRDVHSGFVMDVAPGRRAWALLAGGGVRRLHAVPAPWRTGAAGVQVVLATGDGLAESRIVVGDPAYAGVLDYLATGSLAAAADLLHADDRLAAAYTQVGATELLRDKGSSPFGACAAAYALLGSGVPGEDARWHAWIANLSGSFEWLPDGAIALARLRLSQARSDADIDAALPIVMEALGRGVPFYRQGFDWLLQSMLQFEGEPAMREMMASVREAAAALDMTQVFTTLRL